MAVLSEAWSMARRSGSSGLGRQGGPTVVWVMVFSFLSSFEFLVCAAVDLSVVFVSFLSAAVAQ
jgi:hypothetical protein